jgi:hypothetical protein
MKRTSSYQQQLWENFNELKFRVERLANLFQNDFTRLKEEGITCNEYITNESLVFNTNVDVLIIELERLRGKANILFEEFKD